MKRVLIVGASGFVGSQIAISLRDDYRVFGTYFQNRRHIEGVPTFHFALNTSAPIQEFIRVMRPDAVVYASAWIDHRQCEKDPAGALFINAEAPAIIASVLQSYGGRFIYLSSSKVFAGTEGGYGEEDTPQPQGPYGASKLRGEEALRRYENAAVLRLGTVFGLGGTKQPAAILNRILEALWSKQETGYIVDEYRSFIDVHEIARAVKLLIEAPEDLSELYHLASHEKDSYYSFARAVAEALELSCDLFKPIPGRQFAGKEAVSGGARGSDLSMRGDLFEKTFSTSIETPRRSLARLRERLRHGNQ